MSAESMGMEQDELQGILQEFFTEADENLDKFEQDLIQLESLSETGGTDKETIDRLFRGLHTLKGGAGFLGLEKMAKLAHAGEDLLDEVRQGHVSVTKPVMDALLQTSDGLKELLKTYKAQESDESHDYSALISVLQVLKGGGSAAATPPPAAPAKSKAAAPAPAPVSSVPAGAVDPSLVNKELLAQVIGDDSLDPSKDKGEDGPKAAKSTVAPASDMVNKELLAQVIGDDSLDPSKDKEGGGAAAASAAVAPAAPKASPSAADAQKAAEKMAAAKKASGNEDTETIRVETSRLDKVMNLVGELVLARNSLLRQLNDPHVKPLLEKAENQTIIFSNLEQLSRVTQDLQMSVLSTRMQPIKKVFDKIPRQVRELKTKLKKEVNLVIEGENTEVDKSLVEELADPMVHMIRNALDHGIEGPDEREMNGKAREGTLVIRAFYEGNNVVIQVQEDGKGIDPIKIRKVAVSKGVITESAAANMTDAEAIRLIMAPGFSTAEKISDVSGRGVGMDVVNTKIMNLQGSLDIRSEVGHGTCFSIYMPLTLAIVNALIVGSNDEGFAIPIGDISEVIKFKMDGIHRVSSQDVIELRGEPLPLYHLSNLTKSGYIPSRIGGADQVEEVAPSEDLSLDDLEKAVKMAQRDAVVVGDVLAQKKPNSGFVVIVRDGTHAMGLVVDCLLGQEEVVVKPVTDIFEYNRAISGATITGDGKVHMILDVPFLLKDLSGVR